MMIMMMLCYRDRSIPKDSNFMQLFYHSLKKFAAMYKVYVQLILSEINLEQLNEMMKLSLKTNYIKIISNQSINHRYIFNILQKYMHCFKDAFYSNHNFNIFLKYLKHFISMQYGCGIELSSIYHSFKVPDDRSSIWRPYFYSLVYTLLNGIVVFYLKKYFRWCEFNSVVPTVAYFTYECWRKMSIDFINDLTKNNIIQKRNPTFSTSVMYSNEYINRTYVLTHSIGRLSMKRSGKAFRLVINANYHLLSSKNLVNKQESNSNIPHSIEHCLSLNQRLKLNNGLFEFFRKLRIEFPGVYAPSLLSTKSAFNTLLSFRSLVYSIGFRRFWIAKLDILDCFNQINHSKLLEIFSNILNEVSDYMYPTPNKRFLIRELEWLLKESIISIDGKFYSFVKGIPQGSCISSDLANIYLTQLDRELYNNTQFILWSPHKSLQNNVFKTTNIHLSKCSTILRYLDDYLCISTSKIELQNVIKKINTILNSYGLKLNEQKSETNLNDPNFPVQWLGIEIHSSLAITLPKTDSPPKFCRFSGQPLSANGCMRRLCKFRLHCPIWRFTFHKIIYDSNIRQNIFNCKNVNIRKTDYLLQINANRLGNRIADIVWITLKTSPDKERLLQPSICRRLAQAVFRCISVNIGFSRFWLYHITVNSFIRRLLPHKGELKWLIVWMQQFSSLNKTKFLFHHNKDMSREKAKSGEHNEEQKCQYAVFVQMESLNEKLKLLNYEKKFCKRRHQKPITRHYFAIPTNPGEQFHCFTALAAWLISQVNCKIDQPQEYDDPNATISTILDAIRTLGYNVEFPPLKLKSGCGEYCINVLNMLADASLQVQNIKLLPPKYPEDEVNESGVQDDEASHTDEETEECVGAPIVSRFKYSLPDCDGLGNCEEQSDDDYDDDEVIDLKGLNLKSAQTHRTDLTGKQTGLKPTGKTDEKRSNNNGVLECSTDPADWKLEVERILPQLRVNVHSDIKDWRTHLDQMKKLKMEIETTFQDAKSQLVRLHNDLNSDVDKINNREKYMNNQVESLLAQYRTVQDNLRDITARYREASSGIATRSRTLAEISEELERVKTEMDEKGSSMTDSSSVVRIKQAIQRLKTEITTMDIRTGVLEHILLRTYLRVREDSQKPFSKVIEPSNVNGAFVF
ncbi:unnamed protein product [Schistosoma turkestanicum]|nr:unnamed protein product [Schistosoma turkestanicum]